LFASATPAFLWYSWNYYVEPMQAASIAAFFYLATAAPDHDRRKALIYLILVGTLMMLAKVSSPLYAVAPAAWGIRSWARSRAPTQRRWSPPQLASAGAILILGLGCLCWYWLHTTHVLGFVWNSTQGPGATLFGQ